MTLSDVTTKSEQTLLEHQLLRAASTAARIRVIVVAVFAPLVIALSVAKVPGWGAHLGPVLLYAAVAGVLWVARKHPFFARRSAFFFVFDVLVVFELQRRSLATSPFPAGVAGFSLGLFALLVAMSSVSMQPRATWTVAFVACVAQVTLMRVTGIGLGAIAAAVLVCVALAVALTSLSRRLRQMVRDLASTEVAWRREQEQVQDLKAARDTIATLLVETSAQNERLSRLQEDKEQLTSLLVHDLRSPLGTVRANLDWVKSELPADFDPEVVEALTQSRTVTDRLAGMIGDLLNIAKLESGQLALQRETVPCLSMMTSLQRQLQAQARSRRVSVELEADDVLFEIDRALVTRALENLCSNALRYTPAGGRIRLEALRRDGELVFAIRNDGPVIPLEARGRLFEKYVQAGSTTENRRAGWGLGLYFVKLTLDAHGGQIAVTDEPGWSTSFVLRVPCVVDTPLQNAA
jgi:signal transduction histidine kinase